MSSSSRTNSAMNNNNNDHQRSDASLSNTKKLRRSVLIKNSNDERPSRLSSVSDSLTKINDIIQEHSLSTDINLNNRSLTLRPLSDSYDNNSNKREIGSNEHISNSINKKSTSFSLIVKSSTINKPTERKINLVPSYDSDEELDKTKQNSNNILPMVIAPILTSSDLTKKSRRPDNNVIIQQTDGKSNIEPKLVKLVVPQSINSSSSIKMLSNGDGLSSALRIPTKIQLTKTLSASSLSINQEQQQILPSTTVDIQEKQRSVVDYPPTPPPPVVDNRNLNVHMLNKPNEQDPVKEHTMINSKGIEETDSSIPNEHQTISKRHLSILSDWSVPPTSELSPTSLTSSSPDLSQNNCTPDDSFVELNVKLNRSSMKRRYRSLSFSCPVLPYYIDRNKPITPPYKSKSLTRIVNLSNKKVRSISPVIKYSSVQRLKKRRKDNQFYGKRSKLKTKNDQENIFIIQEILNDMIEQIESMNNHKDNVLKILLNTPVSQLQCAIPIDNKTEEYHSTMMTQNEVAEHMDEMTHEEVNNNNNKTVLQQSNENLSSSSYDLNDNSSMNLFSTELKRQSSTPLSFHSIPSSSTTDEQSIISPHSQSIVSKTHIFTDIVNELIKGAKGLDKLSCSLITFTNSIHDFIRLTNEKQNEKVEQLQRELEKKCSSQLNRANIFCTQKIQYFISKYLIKSIDEHIDEITLIVKYFYLYVLSLNCRKQENEVELILNDLINGKLSCIDQSFHSSILTTIIQDFILTSTLANDYLISQPIVINQNEYSLPFIRNIEFENELLYKNETCLTTNPFSDSNDLEDYLNRCEHMSIAIPCYPVQQPPHPSMYYSSYSHPSPSVPYYYPPTRSTDMTSYYYPPTPTYSNSPQSYTYNHPSSYYNPLTSYGTAYNTNEQYPYYYNQQTSYLYSHANSTNDIPSNHQSYRRMNSNIQRKYSNPPQENQPSMAPTVFDTSNGDSPQSQSTAVTNNIYPS